MVYDFVLFENYYMAYNHYKDVCIIADLLRRGGFTVAIADVFGEATHCQIEGIPHISFKKKSPLDPAKLYASKLKYIRAIFISINKRRLKHHLAYAMRELRWQYRNLYAGSYFTDMGIDWLKEIPDTSVAFFWGLRSARLVETNEKAVNLRQYFDEHPNLKFFVSDGIIRQEFLDLGINANRIVVRPERMIESIPAMNMVERHNGSLKLLSIGSLRETKRIEVILDALRGMDCEAIHYMIAGKAKPSYEEVIKHHSEGLKCVERRNYRLPEEEYNQLIEKCDFLVLCDAKQASSVTNGTLNEALLKGKPVIAPNYNPYKYIIEQFGVGILFNPDDVESLIAAIMVAKQKGGEAFTENIRHYQETLLVEKVSKAFNNEIKEAIAQ